jgi:hemolysin activation/secretion protein
MQFSSTLAGQWSDEALYPSEQIAIAGPFAVRGYRQVSLYGDRGLTWRNELGFPLVVAAGSTTPLNIRPFVGSDFGKIWSHNDVPGGYLSGRTLGASVSFARDVLEVSWSEAGRRSSNLPADHYFFARFAASF